MPDLLLFISKTGFCSFIILILFEHARKIVLLNLHIFDKMRHRIQKRKKQPGFTVEKRRKVFIRGLC